MSHALVTVRHDGRRLSVTPGTRRQKIDEPRSGDRFIAWGVSPRTGNAQPREPWRGDRLRSRREPRPSALECLSPLRGFFDFSTANPGADAPGYESVAPSELKRGLQSGETSRSFFFGVSRKIAGVALNSDHLEPGRRAYSRARSRQGPVARRVDRLPK
jgi:hypothetical protein